MGNCGSTGSSADRRVKEQNARFEAIRDRYETIEEVQKSLREAGLESSELILCLDLTKSNEWSGTESFGGLSLHCTGPQVSTNPYKSVVSIMCRSLAAFDDDQMIPTYGFGDVLSKDHSLLSFEPTGKAVHSLENVLRAYDELIPNVSFSGPTSFAPAIYHAISIVRASKGSYHILVIIADGQVTPGSCLDQTIAAICEASHYPMSIIMIGVGDGPWDRMQEFDDQIPDRRFDNFQFVEFTALSKRAAAQGYSAGRWEAEFALAALMEIPDQYKAISKMNLLGTIPLNRHVPHIQIVYPPKS
eukprot:jgi/Ulvmu1/12001/UM083_0014.1